VVADRLRRAAAQPHRPAVSPLLVGGLLAAGTAALFVVARSPVRSGAPLTFAADSAGATGEVGQGLVRFSDGSTVELDAGARGRVASTTASGARVQLLEGRGLFRIAAAAQGAWAVEAGPFSIQAGPGTLEVSWIIKAETLSVGLSSGQAVVHGLRASAHGVRLTAGETLVARASDGRYRVSRSAAAAARTVDGVASETYALAPAEGPTPRGFLSDEREAGRCPQSEPTPSLRVFVDPGTVNLTSCRHVDPGPVARDVKARFNAEAWVTSDAAGCLKYGEDPRGGRIPDFSYAGYHMGGVALPVVRAPAGVAPLLPANTGDDTPALQAAIDAVSSLPPDERGFRGAVELGPGTFMLKGSLQMLRSGVVLRGSGSEGPGATVLRAVGKERLLIRVGPQASRRLGKVQYPIADAFVPTGARSFELVDLGDLEVGDDIVVQRPMTQRWICALGTDNTSRAWRPTGGLTFERRITGISGKRITVDVPIPNALEREFSQALVTRYDLPERISETGVESLAALADFTLNRCPTSRAKFLKVGAVVNGWARDVRAEGFGGEMVTFSHSSKWITVEDATYVAPDSEHCLPPQAFDLGGQQNLLLRGRTVGPRTLALRTDPEIEGPNAVVDFRAVGTGSRVEVQGNWSTGFLFDNVHMVDLLGEPTGEIEVSHRGGKGWSCANCVVWNSEADTFTVDSPPTAQNWVVGGANNVRNLFGSGTFAGDRAALAPQSLYRAQLAERLGRRALGAIE
jgi:hypothetical protein